MDRALSKLSVREDEAEERTAQLETLLQRLLDADPVDVPRLRSVAASHGLVSAKLRARAWPKLLCADSYDEATSEEALAAAALSPGHPDSGTVRADCERCAWLPREGLEGGALAERRRELGELLDGAVVVSGTHYYQARATCAGTPPLSARSLGRRRTSPLTRAPPLPRASTTSPPSCSPPAAPAGRAPAWWRC